jgi:hypothetical protein
MVQLMATARAAKAAEALTAAQKDAREARTEAEQAAALEGASSIAGMVTDLVYRGDDGKKEPLLSKSGKSFTFGYGKLPDDVADAVAEICGLPRGTTLTLTIGCRTTDALRGVKPETAAKIIAAAKARRAEKDAKQGAEKAEGPDNSGAWAE